MKRNKLYTVNKWNKRAFIPIEDYTVQYPNIFDWGGLANQAQANGMEGLEGLDGNKLINAYKNSANLFGISKIDNPFSKGNLAGGSKAMLNTSIGKSALGAVGGIAGSAAYKGLSGGLNSGAGKAISSIGSAVGGAASLVNPVLGAAVKVASGIIGGGINALVGTSVDQKKLQAAREGTQYLNNFVSTADNFDDIKSVASVANVQNAYKSGLLNKGWARRRNRSLREERADARSWAYRGIENNINNLASDQLNDSLANYAAYGGPLGFGTGALGLMQQNRYFDTIDKRSDAIASKTAPLQTAFTGGAKTFDTGGDMLAYNFLDNFGKDPIGAVLSYTRGLERAAAEREAVREENERSVSDLAAKLRAAAATSYSNLDINHDPRLDALPTVLKAGAQALNEAQKTTREANDYSELMDFIKAHEGFKSKAYWLEGESAPTIGYGFHTVNPVTGKKIAMGDRMTKEEADLGLRNVIGNISNDLSKKVPNWDTLKPHQQHALIDLAYGTGTNGKHFQKKSRLMTALREGDMERAERELVSRSASLPSYDDYLLKISKRRQDMFRNGNYSMKAFGGELGTNGTDFTNGLLYVDAGGSHEDNSLGGVPMGVDAEGTPNLVEEGETVYDNYVFSNRMEVPKNVYKDLGLGGSSKKKITFADASKKLAQESEQRPNDPISTEGLKASLAKLAAVQEAERMKEQAREYVGLEQYACGGKLGRKYAGPGELPNIVEDPSYYKWIRKKENPYSKLWEKEESLVKNPFVDDIIINSNGLNLYPYRDIVFNDKSKSSFWKPNHKTPIIDTTSDNQESDTEYTTKVPPQYPTWMRYAPAVGTGAFAITDALGITNKPDYQYVRGLEAAAQAAGYAPQIQADPIGDYLTYMPMDIWQEQNRLNANARATDRSLTNIASPSRAAGLLASGYNNQVASGDLYRKALEYNDAKRMQVADFNRKTNMFNSQMGLEAAMANARYRQQASQLGLSGLAQAIALRDAIDQRVGAARSTNITNLLDNLGAIGRENFAMNQLNSAAAAHNGYFGNLSGRAQHMDPTKAKGGKINRRKK